MLRAPRATIPMLDRGPGSSARAGGATNAPALVIGSNLFLLRRRGLLWSAMQRDWQATRPAARVGLTSHPGGATRDCPIWRRMVASTCRLSRWFGILTL